MYFSDFLMKCKLCLDGLVYYRNTLENIIPLGYTYITWPYNVIQDITKYIFQNVMK